MSSNEIKPESDNGEDSSEIDWLFSSPLQVVFAGIFVICAVLIIITNNKIFEIGMGVGITGYFVFRLLDEREK